MTNCRRKWLIYFFLFLIFLKINFIAFKKLPFSLASLAEKIPGLLFNDFTHIPESSDITGKFTKFEKYLAFNLELAIKVDPVSLGLGICSVFGEIFLYLFDNK